MAVFRCLILGENFPVLDEADGRKLIGFYTTRYVEAADDDMAEQMALVELKKDKWLAGLRQNIDPDDPEAKVYFEEIVEVEEISGAAKGFTFFDMENGANNSESECR